MVKLKGGALVLALVLLAAPAIGQGFSESYNFLKGVRERDGSAVQEILNRRNPAILNTRDLQTGEGALHIVVRERNLQWLRTLLAYDLRPDLQSADGTTPLGLAAQLGWRDGAEALVARGANVNLGNSRGETPLIFAVQRRDLTLVRFLMSQGADPDQTDNVAGYSALDYARQDNRSAPILRELERPRRIGQ